ncbi:hypothetical protein EC835_101256 [Providencia alcalifaciens]|uniref:Uncharacterized protein n=1 Tax=Providencia alcalifaciens TaxID=126385 RepID=A0A4R3NYJ4_9GAMM|nr:hypothetical protein [Providencia alcalifaciens]TCT38260.1 hypothetical protein EC835_101256 [Providencia alcalifaciens]
MGNYSQYYQNTVSYTEASIALIIGTLPLLLLPNLPRSSHYLVTGIILLVTLVIIWRNKRVRFLALMGMGVSLGLLAWC